jgi:hypothetical protein
VLTSGSQLRPGPPPAYDSAQEATELSEVKNLARTTNTNRIAYFWQFGASPGSTSTFIYWNAQTSQKISEYRLDSHPPRAARVYAIESVAFYDSTVACWDAKYAYWAIRPFQLDPTLTTLFPTPNHPSYPGAHAALSAAAAATLGYLFPREAATFKSLAENAADSRLYAGIHFRSDNEVGLALGRAVAQMVIERAKQDGSQ